MSVAVAKQDFKEKEICWSKDPGHKIYCQNKELWSLNLEYYLVTGEHLVVSQNSARFDVILYVAMFLNS